MEWPELSANTQSVAELSPGWLPAEFRVAVPPFLVAPKPATPSPTQICPFRGFSPPNRQPCCRSPWVGRCQAGHRATSPSQTPAQWPPRARPPGASQTTEPSPIQRPPQTPPGTPPPFATTGFFPVSLPHQGRVWGGPGDATRPRQPCGGSDVGAIPNRRLLSNPARSVTGEECGAPRRSSPRRLYLIS